MALTSAFTFTNATPSTTKSVTLLDMKEANYSWDKTAAGRNLYKNPSCLRDCPETIEYRFNNDAYTAKQNFNLEGMDKSRTPSRCTKVTVNLDAALQTIDSTDAKFREVDPMRASLTLVFPNSRFVATSHVETLLTRLVSSLQKEDGTWRVGELISGDIKLDSN